MWNATTSTTAPSLSSMQDPTPEEIAARCAAIRENWSDSEMGRRRVNSARLSYFVAKVNLPDDYKSTRLA